MDILVQRRKWMTPPSSEELAASVASLEGSIEVLSEVKTRLDEAYAALTLVEHKVHGLREQIERVDDKRRELLAGIG